MPIEIKVLASSLLLWVIAYLLAFPGGMFAKWGEKKAGSYETFLVFISLPSVLAIVIAFLSLIWK